MDRPNGEAGFTLIEALVASSIGIVVTLGIAQSMVATSQMARSTKLDTDFNMLVAQMQMIMNNTSLCQTALKATNGTTNVSLDNSTSSISIPKFNMRTTTIADSTVTPTSGLRIVSMTLMNPTGCAVNSCTWTFRVEAKKVGHAGNMLGTETIYRRFPVLITQTANPGTIASCP